MWTAILLCLSLSVTGGICEELAAEAADLGNEIAAINAERAAFDADVTAAFYACAQAVSGLAGARNDYDDYVAELAELDPESPSYQADHDNLIAQIYAQSFVVAAASLGADTALAALNDEADASDEYYDETDEPLALLGESLDAVYMDIAANEC